MNENSAVMQNDSVGRKERERDQRRREILEAALGLFSQKGYEGTSMAEIAAASEFAVGTLYKFFKDKNDLYQALVADTMRQYEVPLVEALRSAGSPADRIDRFVETAAGLFVRHLPMSRVYFSQTAAAFLFPSAGLEDEAFHSYSRIIESLRATFEEGLQNGEFSGADAAVLARSLEGVLGGFLSALVRDPGSYRPDQIAALTRRVFFGPTLVGR